MQTVVPKIKKGGETPAFFRSHYCEKVPLVSNYLVADVKR